MFAGADRLLGFVMTKYSVGTHYRFLRWSRLKAPPSSSKCSTRRQRRRLGRVNLRSSGLFVGCRSSNID
ncbi:hypothetical protein PC119_g22339 [Phytophthora cactorum]|nr:hypothetical protein PC119_g22339 [Phytophthora cactorum]